MHHCFVYSVYFAELLGEICSEQFSIKKELLS